MKSTILLLTSSSRWICPGDILRNFVFKKIPKYSVPLSVSLMTCPNDLSLIIQQSGPLYSLGWIRWFSLTLSVWSWREYVIVNRSYSLLLIRPDGQNLHIPSKWLAASSPGKRRRHSIESELHAKHSSIHPTTERWWIIHTGSLTVPDQWN